MMTIYFFIEYAVVGIDASEDEGFEFSRKFLIPFAARLF